MMKKFSIILIVLMLCGCMLKSNRDIKTQQLIFLGLIVVNDDVESMIEMFPLENQFRIVPFNQFCSNKINDLASFSILFYFDENTCDQDQLIDYYLAAVLSDDKHALFDLKLYVSDDTNLRLLELYRSENNDVYIKQSNPTFIHFDEQSTMIKLPIQNGMTYQFNVQLEKIYQNDIKLNVFDHDLNLIQTHVFNKSDTLILDKHAKFIIVEDILGTNLIKSFDEPINITLFHEFGFGLRGFVDIEVKGDD